MLKRSIFLFIYFIFLFEIFSFIFTKLNFFTFNETPQIYKGNKYFSPGTNWRNEEKSWGAWHKENFKDVHSLNCFNVVYESNNVGARDKFFSLNSKKKRSIILGDSMTEGLGLNLSERFDEILEQKRGHEILNFGSGGDLGPLSYYLIYKDLASKFEHENLFIFFFPQNDFLDHNYKIWKHNGWNIINTNKRYRPYSKKINNDRFEIYYEENAVPRKEFDSGKDSLNYELKLFMKKYLWSTNLLRSIIYKLKNSKKNQINDEINLHKRSFYFDKNIQKEDAFFWINEILKISKNKDVFIFILPSYNDLNYIKKNTLTEPLWINNLNNIKDKNKNLIKIINLAEFFKDEPESYFHNCDFHYNSKANIIISNVIEEIIF